MLSIFFVLSSIEKSTNSECFLMAPIMCYNPRTILLGTFMNHWIYHRVPAFMPSQISEVLSEQSSLLIQSLKDMETEINTILDSDCTIHYDLVSEHPVVDKVINLKRNPL